MTTDKTQELDEILGQLISKTADASYGEWQVVGLHEAKQAIVEWHEIEKSEVYNSGCADTVRHILALFDNQIPEQLKWWLRLEIEDRGKL